MRPACTVTGCTEPATLALDVLDVPRDYCRTHWGDAAAWLLTGVTPAARERAAR